MLLWYQNVRGKADTCLQIAVLTKGNCPKRTFVLPEGHLLPWKPQLSVEQFTENTKKLWVSNVACG